jgi:alpha-galactosidase
MILTCIAALQVYSLSSLDLKLISQGWGRPGVNRSVDQNPITIGGRVYSSGIGTHAASAFYIDTAGKALRFSATVGVDDEVAGKPGSVEFRVLGAGKTLWRSGVMRPGNAGMPVSLDVRGIKTLVLLVGSAGDGIDYDHADWADAQLTMASGEPRAVRPPSEPAVILTPKPPKTPRLTGPRVFGARPGNPFLFRVTATGERPLSFSISGLPPGLSVDRETGIITGVTPAKGDYRVRVTASNTRGKASRELRIIAGERIALTPPLGWNSWNCFAGDVDQAKVLSAATEMVRSGLADHGWSHINIDDCWSIKPGDKIRGGTPRSELGRINTNALFPNMKALCDSIHALGLRAGIYSSPGPLTCAGFTASYMHEKRDAEQWAEWGFDYLKYDWCSYGGVAKSPPDIADLQRPYKEMRAALNTVRRDIVFSLCQYGMGEVWKWGKSVGGNCWRTTGDIVDTWESMSGIGFSQNGHERYAEPGCWNDPDMLVVGWVGWGPSLHPTRLTPNEQYTHISLWSLLAAPLLIGCDLTKLDDFTKNLLTNDEVLDVNQDPLGKPAKRISKVDETEVWARPLEDGSWAVGMFNLGETSTRVSVSLARIGVSGPCRVRDLWRQKDIGEHRGSFSAIVPRHGVALVKVRSL